MPEAAHGICLITHGEDVFLSAGIRCADEAETQFLGQNFGCNSVAENPIVEQIWGDHDKRPSRMETTSDFGECLPRMIEMLDDHATRDQMKAVVRKWQTVQRSAEQGLDIAVMRDGEIHADDEPAMRGKPVFKRVHIFFEQTRTAASIEPDSVRGEVLRDKSSVRLGFRGPLCSGDRYLDKRGQLHHGMP